MPDDTAPNDAKLILMVDPAARVRATETRSLSAASEGGETLADVLEKHKAEARLLFGETEERLHARAESAAPGAGLGLESFYEVSAPKSKLSALQKQLLKSPAVVAAYEAPEPALPMAATRTEERPLQDLDEDGALNAMVASPAPVPAATPNYTAQQGYLDPAPGGIDARYAWTIPGGRGDGISVIDCEGAWRFTHEDLRQNQGGVIGTQTSDIGWRNHGTAVAGEIGGDNNVFGVTGICANANIRGSSIFDGGGTAGAIRAAADRLSPGDIILIEVQFGHPTLGYTAVEWWPAEWAAIRYAVGRGVIVVEAAGNGNNNLDNPVYDTPLTGFPADWSNPFRRGARDSGAVVVGAGAPPSGNFGPDRSRLGFSNYGSMVDVQGWGREVVTCGYGDLQGGGNEDLWYTQQFSGTSSASPIVVGALGCIQGILRARSASRLTPATARALLRNTGTPQTDAPGRPVSQRIGNRPNLRQMVSNVIGTGVRTVRLYRYWNPIIGDHFYTTNWRELGRGRHGWRYEGVQCYVYPRRVRGTVALYRYWNPTIGDHFYTTNWSELGRGRHGWRYEGIAGWVSRVRSSGTRPLYRYWNPIIGDHFYTTNWSELGRGRHGWRYEGVQCYVWPTGASAPDAESAEDASDAPVASNYGEPEMEPEEAMAAAADWEQKGSGAASTSPEPGPEAEGEPIPFSAKVEAGIGAADDAPESFATEGDAAPEGSFELTSERGGQEGGGRVVTINLNL